MNALAAKAFPDVPAAVLGVDFNDVMVRVCGWCPEKKQGDAWAARLGFRVSHGICRECAVKFGGASARPSCAVSSATAGRDRHVLHTSTASLPADRVASLEDYVGLTRLAQVVGLDEEKIVPAFRRLCFRPGFDFDQIPSGMIVRRAILPELVGHFATSGQLRAATMLMAWLTAQQQPAAAPVFRVDPPVRKAPPEAAKAPAVVGWAHEWEEQHQ